MNRLQQTFECDSPVAVITGSGAPRVGRAIATNFARAGCRVVIHSNRSVTAANEAAASLTADYNIETLVVLGGLEDDATPDRIVDQTRKKFGRIDVLVNSAAIWSPTKLEDVTSDELRRYFDVNAVGSFQCARAAGLAMVEQPTGGAITNIGDWGTCRPYRDHAAYFPSKGAVEVMTRSLAVELAQRNPRIRVNCIQPGTVLLGDQTPEEHRQQLADCTLVRRIGTAEEVAHAVQFVSENAFVTGVCLPVDGGRSIYASDGLQVGLNTG